MKCFLLGFLGFFVGLVLFALMNAAYSDFRSRAETANWMATTISLRDEIQANFEKTKQFRDLDKGVDWQKFKQKDMTLFEVNGLGEILIRGGREGQLILLRPIMQAGKFEWQCVGGSKASMPLMCR